VTTRSFIKPPALRPGATLAVVSPASTPKRELVERGIAELEALGYGIKLGKYALSSGPLYYAGSLAERLDRELIRANPKAFVGYSDHTSLHSWFQNEVDLTSFYAPMVASDFGREDGVDIPSWRNVFDGASGWSLGAADGLRVLQQGTAEGKLLGGCISILAAGLGTPFAPRLAGSVLFLEDIGTKPYQWDRMLLHLRYSGRLEDVRGIVFGDMEQCVEGEERELLERAILHGLRGFAGPVAIGLRCGHVHGANISLPLGVEVRLDLSDAADPRLTFLEAAVSG
jgi:muramoyltetrapeptide carboxypeptidase